MSMTEAGGLRGRRRAALPGGLAVLVAAIGAARAGPESTLETGIVLTAGDRRAA